MEILVAGVPGPPAAPEVCHVLSTSCTVRYQLPEDEGDAPVTGYHVEMAGEETEWVRVNDTMITDLEFIVEHCKPLSQYRFRVAAENQFGVGEYGPASPFVSCLEDELPSLAALQRYVIYTRHQLCVFVSTPTPNFSDFFFAAYDPKVEFSQSRHFLGLALSPREFTHHFSYFSELGFPRIAFPRL